MPRGDTRSLQSEETEFGAARVGGTATFSSRNGYLHVQMEAMTLMNLASQYPLLTPFLKMYRVP